MLAFMIAAALSPVPALPALPATTDMAPEFRAQQQAAMHGIRLQIQADLELSGTRFFSSEGELRRLLDRGLIAETGLAAR